MYVHITLLISCILILYSQVIEVEASVEKDYIHPTNGKIPYSVNLVNQEIKSYIDDETVKVTDSSVNVNKSKVLKFKEVNESSDIQSQVQHEEDTDLSGIINDSDVLIDQIKSESVNNKDSLYYLSFGYVALILLMIYLLFIKQ